MFTLQLRVIKRGGLRSLFAKNKTAIHVSRNMKWPFHETKIKGVKLPVGIKRPGAQNDD